LQRFSAYNNTIQSINNYNNNSNTSEGNSGCNAFMLPCRNFTHAATAVPHYIILQFDASK